MLLIKICEFFITLQTIHNRPDPYWVCFSIEITFVALKRLFETKLLKKVAGLMPMLTQIVLLQ